MNRFLQKQREKLKNTENSLVVSVIEVHLKTIHEWVNKTWGYGTCVFFADDGITTGINLVSKTQKECWKTEAFGNEPQE